MEIRKYQLGGTPIYSWKQIMQNVKPGRLQEFLNQKTSADPKQPQLNSISQEEINRQRRQQKEMKSQAQIAKWLSKNQHLWNWVSPLMNTTSTNQNNATNRFDYSADSRNAMIYGASLVASPIPTVVGLGAASVGSSVGGKVGEKMGNRQVGEFIGGLLGGWKGVKWANNVARRGIETAMRTTASSNPILEIKDNLKSMLHGRNGGIRRLSTIGRYILTGDRKGKKGYYNSLAGYGGEGNTDYYGGFFDPTWNVGRNYPGNDYIDAFLYNKTVDPAYGVKKVAQGRDFGPHSKYMEMKFGDKYDRTPVYEVVNKNRRYAGPVENVKQWTGNDEITSPIDFITDKGWGVNVGGHLIQRGTTPGGYPVVRGQDIWKFDPKEYMKKWMNDYSDEPMSKYKKFIINHGLRAIDKYGTPIITRTGWQRALFR